MQLAPDQRRRDLATIHLAKKQLAMADDSYRDMLWTCGRVRSSADLDHAGRQRVIDHLKACGFVARPTIARKTSEWSWVDAAAEDRKPLLRKVIVLARRGGKGKGYVDALCKRLCGIEDCKFAGVAELRKVVSALVYDSGRRDGGR